MNHSRPLVVAPQGPSMPSAFAKASVSGVSNDAGATVRRQTH